MSTSASAQQALDQGEPFAERVERLANELRRAIRYDRPSILLAVYRSHYVLLEAQTDLVKLLAPLEQRIEQVTITAPDEADLPLRLIEHPERAGTIFFVRGLRNGGVEALRALNIRRELLVEQRIRVVFWLMEQEAIDLAHQAPDFWAFRHRVVEFLDPADRDLAALTVRQQNERDEEDYSWAEEIAARINLRETLLAELDSGSETASARAQLYEALGDLELRRADYAAARGHYNAALRLYELIGDRRSIANTLMSLGTLEDRLDNLETARGRYDTALSLSQAINDNLGTANILRRLGDLELRGVNYAAARGHYDAALRLYELDNDPLGIANTYQRLGEVDERLGNLEAARSRYDAALALYQAISDRLGTANALKGLGSLELQLGNYTAARDHYSAALPLYQVIGDRLGIANTLHGLGDLERQLNNLAAARRHFEAALALYQTMQSNSGVINTLIGLADLDRRTGDHAGIADRFRTVLDLAKQVGLDSHPVIQRMRDEYASQLTHPPID